LPNPAVNASDVPKKQQQIYSEVHKPTNIMVLIFPICAFPSSNIFKMEHFLPLLPTD